MNCRRLSLRSLARKAMISAFARAGSFAIQSIRVLIPNNEFSGWNNLDTYFTDCLLPSEQALHRRLAMLPSQSVRWRENPSAAFLTVMPRNGRSNSDEFASADLLKLATPASYSFAHSMRRRPECSIDRPTKESAAPKKPSYRPRHRERVDGRLRLGCGLTIAWVPTRWSPSVGDGVGRRGCVAPGRFFLLATRDAFRDRSA